MPQPDFCIIYNPAAGRGRARRSLDSLKRAFGEQAEFQATQAIGHAEELARTAALAGFAVVAGVGGDGTIHEVANGILGAGRPNVALAVVPLGSANDYAHSLGIDDSWWLRSDLPIAERRVDVGLVQSPSGRERYFINGLGLGFNGAVTLESRQIKRFRGVALYGIALLRALVRHYALPLMTITLDGKEREVRTLALTVSLGRREGNFVLAPHAKLDDGLFDYVHAGPLSRLELLRYVPGMVTGNMPQDDPKVWVGHCHEAQVRSEAPLIVHLDGEFFCLPKDSIRNLHIRLLPLALKVYGRWPK